MCDSHSGISCSYLTNSSWWVGNVTVRLSPQSTSAPLAIVWFSTTAITMLVIGKNKEYLVLLEWANFAFGGRQAWFLCPPQGCERWVAILYSGSVFACRHCYKFTYACQRENAGHRAIQRADCIRKQLRWRPCIANPIVINPRECAVSLLSS